MVIREEKEKYYLRPVRLKIVGQEEEISWINHFYLLCASKSLRSERKDRPD
jgi:hypothetical protein